MDGGLICELCGTEGEPLFTASSCCRGDINSAQHGILTFSMGVYSLRLCTACRSEYSDDELTQRLREKVRHSSSIDHNKK